MLPNTIRVPFTANLINESLRYVTDHSLIVFPTEISASEARKQWLKNWQFEDCQFITMDQLKKDLLLPSKPCVSDDKRLLTLYLAMTQQDRDFFHISGYFDVVEWGQPFLHFFEELVDECVDAGKLDDVFGNFGFNLLAWQETNLSQILGIRRRYLEILTTAGLSDTIFTDLQSFCAPNPVPRRVVFVNQFYYSALELALISKLADSGCEIITIAQDVTGTPEAQEVELAALKPGQIRTRNLQVIECGNQDQMILAFLSQLHDVNRSWMANSVLVDSHFHQSHYSHLFDPAYFSYSESSSVLRFGVFKLLSILGEHLEGLEKSLDQSFLPIGMVIGACTQEQFIAYYQPDWKIEERIKLLSELKVLLEQSILYIDQELSLFQLLEGKKEFVYLPQILRPHFSLLRKLSQVAKPGDLIDLIDAPDGVIIKRLCSQKDLQFSDVLEKSYERIANFATLADFELVPSWRDLFATSSQSTAVSMMKLLLESLTSIRIQERKRRNPEEGRIDISSMLNLRNLQHDTTIFFHTIEGEYPSSPGATWLLNENQRASIGLKSYPDLRMRERYYFLRQVFSSQNVVIFSYRNLEQDIEPGSFLTELLHHKQLLEELGVAIQTTTINPTMEDLYSARKLLYAPRVSDLAAAHDKATHGVDKNDPASFFTLPPAPVADFGETHALNAAFYSLKTLSDNPFLWYIYYRNRLQTVEYRPKETITHLLFGAMLHGYISKVLKPLRGNQHGCSELARVLDDPHNLSNSLSELIHQSLYLFKLPQNYNHEFLVSVISECIVSSVRQFYSKYLLPKLDSARFDFIPEQDDLSDLKPHKTLVKCICEEEEYTLNIQGKADLRIECASEFMIIDFKTGRGSVDQLLCYEWFYYLLDSEFSEAKLSSTFWKILEPGSSESTSDKKRTAWKEKMAKRFEDCLKIGFTQGKTAESRKELMKITRADIFLLPAGGSDE